MTFTTYMSYLKLRNRIVELEKLLTLIESWRKQYYTKQSSVSIAIRTSSWSLASYHEYENYDVRAIPLYLVRKLELEKYIYNEIYSKPYPKKPISSRKLLEILFTLADYVKPINIPVESYCVGTPTSCHSDHIYIYNIVYAIPIIHYEYDGAKSDHRGGIKHKRYSRYIIPEPPQNDNAVYINTDKEEIEHYLKPEKYYPELQQLPKDVLNKIKELILQGYKIVVSKEVKVNSGSRQTSIADYSAGYEILYGDVTEEKIEEDEDDFGYVKKLKIKPETDIAVVKYREIKSWPGTHVDTKNIIILRRGQ